MKTNASINQTMEAQENLCCLMWRCCIVEVNHNYPLVYHISTNTFQASHLIVIKPPGGCQPNTKPATRFRSIYKKLIHSSSGGHHDHKQPGK